MVRYHGTSTVPIRVELAVILGDCTLFCWPSPVRKKNTSRATTLWHVPRGQQVSSLALPAEVPSCKYPTSQSGSPEATAMGAGGPSPLAGPHRALDGVGQFADHVDLRALRAVGKSFPAYSRLPAATKRAFLQRWDAKATSRSTGLRLEAVRAVARCLGVEAEDFLTEILKKDRLRAVRAASVPPLAGIARLAAPATKRRIFAMVCARYDAEQGYCLLYTSPSPRDRQKSRMPSSA